MTERRSEGRGSPGPALEAVIGLEIHVQLKTRSKMFCGNAAEYGVAPNTHVCPVCLGLPGALPVVNGRAVELAMCAALGLRCQVHPRSEFVRKSYFYPDLPKGYQITQHQAPLATGGYLEVAGRRVRIRRVHLEEDTGKSLHDRIPGASVLDFNRAGVPLIEIVTEPDLRDPAEARACLDLLKQVLQYLEVSDCNMEQGSLRVDANVSVRRPGAPLGTKTELKNLNSFANVERALRFELDRQRRLHARAEPVVPQTLLWDAARGEARPMRSKEELHEYRYFPEPDLPPLEIEVERVEAIRRGLPEMPWERAGRLQHEHGLSPEHAAVLTATRPLADYFEEVVERGAAPADAASWVMGEVLSAVNARGEDLERFPVRPQGLAALLALVASGELSRPLARRVLEQMLETGRSASQVVAEEGLAMERDSEAVHEWVDQVLVEHPDEVARFRAGDARLLGFFVGQVMRRSAGRADPRQVDRVLRGRLAS